MRHLSSAVFATLMAIVPLAPVARADTINISVTPWLGANAYGSPSYSQAVQNAVYAEMHNQNSYGSGPSQFQGTTSGTTAQAIVTGFNSWMGVADPSDPAYSGELGNRILFATAITSASGFSIGNLSFAMSSVGTDDFNGVAKPAGSYTYGYNYTNGTLTSYWVGVDAQGNMIVDPTYSGTVVALYGSGSGASEPAYCNGCTTTAQRQPAINYAANNPPGPYSVSGTYSLNGHQGTGTINLASPLVTPEPSTFALLGTGILGLAGTARRKFRKA